MPEFDSGSKQLNEPHIPELKYEFCYNMYAKRSNLQLVYVILVIHEVKRLLICLH